MDPIRNSYSRGAAAPPPELLARDRILEQARVRLGRTRKKGPEKSLLPTDLRGVVKTVLLNASPKAHPTADISDTLEANVTSLGARCVQS